MNDITKPSEYLGYWGEKYAEFNLQMQQNSD